MLDCLTYVVLFYKENIKIIVAVCIFLILVCVFLQNRLIANYLTKGIKKILQSSIPNVTKRVEAKIIEKEYKEKYLEYLNSKYKAIMYTVLSVLICIQIILLLYDQVDDWVAVEIIIFTGVIAVIESRDNWNKSKKQKCFCDKINKELIDYYMQVTDEECEKLAEDYIKENGNIPLTALEKYHQANGIIEREKNIRLYDKSGKKLQECIAYVKMKRINEALTIIIRFKKRKMKFIASKYTDSHNLTFSDKCLEIKIFTQSDKEFLAKVCPVKQK